MDTNSRVSISAIERPFDPLHDDARLLFNQHDRFGRAYCELAADAPRRAERRELAIGFSLVRGRGGVAQMIASGVAKCAHVQRNTTEFRVPPFGPVR
jgi:hypothetical protein